MVVKYGFLNEIDNQLILFGQYLLNGYILFILNKAEGYLFLNLLDYW